MRQASIDPMLAPPPRMGAYSLLAPIGAGGMGAVYLARKIGIEEDERYAIKVMLPHLTGDARFVSLFLHEARIAAQIRHRNVCRVIDYGSEEGTYYIAMEHLRGHTLSEVLGRLSGATSDRASTRRVLMSILADVADGLEHAHELKSDDDRPMRIVHRDVCTPNLFVTDQGIAKVLDFGIALYADRSFRTSTGEMKGHLAYVAPEILAGMRADRSADIWSLAVIAWEAIALERLFRRDSEAATINAVLHEPVPRLSERFDDVPPAVDDALARGLARERGQRVGSAVQLMAEIFDAFGFERAPAPEVAAQLARWMPDRVGGRAADDQAVEPGEPVGDTRTVSTDDHPTFTRSRAGRARIWIVAAAAGLIAFSASMALFLLRPDEPVLSQQLPTLALTAPEHPAAEPVEVEAKVEPAPEVDAPAPSRARRPARAGSGELVVPPGGEWSEVWVDGERLGFSPLARSLPSGRHRVTLRRDGEVLERRTVVIRPGKRTVLRPPEER